MEQHSSLAQLIANNKKSMGFNIPFPDISKGDKTIPVSSIALKLMNAQNDNDNDNDEQQASIIEAFVELYAKYIDASNACFMINISSQHRDALEHLLDKNYYFKIHSQRVRRRHSKNQQSTSLNMLKLQQDDSSISTNVNDVKVTCLIEYEFNKRKNQEMSPALECLLEKLIVPMDNAAREIAALMNDSFSRFRKIVF